MQKRINTPKIVEEIVDELKKEFISNCKGILLEGSFAYGCNREYSDLDVEIVVDDFGELGDIKPLEIFSSLFIQIKQCLMVVKQSQGIRLIQVKSDINGINTGIRFIRKKDFVDVSQLDLVSLKKDIYMLSVRAQVKRDQSLIYTQRNFFGEVMEFEKNFWVISGRQFTFVPVALFSQEGKFYPGSIIDRYLCLPKIIFDPDKLLVNCIENLEVNVLRRYYKEIDLSKEKSKNVGVFHCLHCWDKLPFEVKAEIYNWETNIYREVPRR